MPHVIAALAIFRVIYFLLPLVIALALLGAHELALRGGRFSKQGRPMSDAEPEEVSR